MTDLLIMAIIPGAVEKVSLRKRTAKVSCDREVNIEEIKKRFKMPDIPVGKDCIPQSGGDSMRNY